MESVVDTGWAQFVHVLIVFPMLAVCFYQIDPKVGIDVKFSISLWITQDKR